MDAGLFGVHGAPFALIALFLLFVVYVNGRIVPICCCQSLRRNQSAFWLELPAGRCEAPDAGDIGAFRQGAAVSPIPIAAVFHRRQGMDCEMPDHWCANHKQVELRK
jgi:hypothetical protein